MVIISEFVKDIQEITECLLGPHSQCTAMEVIDCLYCIATFLLEFKERAPKDVFTGYVGWAFEIYFKAISLSNIKSFIKLLLFIRAIPGIAVRGWAPDFIIYGGWVGQVQN